MRQVHDRYRTLLRQIKLPPLRQLTNFLFLGSRRFLGKTKEEERRGAFQIDAVRTLESHTDLTARCFEIATGLRLEASIFSCDICWRAGSEVSFRFRCANVATADLTLPYVLPRSYL